MLKKFLSLMLVAAFVLPVFAQATDKKTVEEKEAETRKEAVAFLRETMADVNNMRSLENRISFASEMAGLMWFHDEREARGMFTGVINDFKELLTRYDADMNALGNAEGDDDFGFSLFSGPSTNKSQLNRKFSTAMSVRQQIAMSLAEHDPELAFSFYSDSVSVVSNPEFVKKFAEHREDSYESMLITQMAEKNAATAVKFASKTLDKGVNYQHVDLLRKIYAKDADKAVEFGSAIVSRLKTDTANAKDFYVFSSLLNFGEETFEASKKEGGKKPVYSQADLRQIADIFAQSILAHKSGEDNDSFAGYADRIEKYQPGRAVQIRSKFSKSKNRGMSVAGIPPPSTQGAVKMSSTATYDGEISVEVGDPIGSNDSAGREREEKLKTEEQMMNDIKNVGTSEMSKEAREKTVAQARKILMATKGKDKKIAGLSMLAAQVAKSGDKELAAEIMRDAQALVNPSPKHFMDFMLVLMLAAGYAESDPDKAFPILEDTIGRFNELLSAFIRIGEFVDVGGEMISDGEVQVGAFGGQMIRGITREIGVAQGTINTLIRADFAKTKTLTNRFDRPEVRILAKMLILRSVLGKKQNPEEQEPLLSLPR